jgi:hypothetical protein
LIITSNYLLFSKPLKPDTKMMIKDIISIVRTKAWAMLPGKGHSLEVRLSGDRTEKVGEMTSLSCSSLPLLLLFSSSSSSFNRHILQLSKFCGFLWREDVIKAIEKQADHKIEVSG